MYVCGTLDHFWGKMQINYYILNVLYFFRMLEAVKQVVSFLTLASSFLWTRAIFDFIYRGHLRIIYRGHAIGLPQNLRMLIISWSWALLGSRSWIIFAISLLVHHIHGITLPVLFQNTKVSFLGSMKGYQQVFNK